MSTGAGPATVNPVVGPARPPGVPDPRPRPFVRTLPPRVLVPAAALLAAALLAVLLVLLLARVS